VVIFQSHHFSGKEATIMLAGNLLFDLGVQSAGLLSAFLPHA